MNNKSIIYSVSDEEFVDIIDSNYTYSDVLRYFGLTTSGESSRKVLKQRISELCLSTEHFNSSINNKSTPKRSLEEILVKDSSYSNRNRLKIRLLNEVFLTYKCYICNINSWLNKPISLHLDHINGINNDNRINNLRLLCPNCHSQTDTYAGKNIGVVQR